jgi:hypothetical protein
VLPFLHERLQTLERLLARSSAVLERYNRLDLDLGPALAAFLDEAVAAHRALGRSSTENELLALQAQFVSALHGTHPLTLERVAVHRRELVRAIALRVLQHSAQLLRSEIERDRQALSEAGQQLRPIVLLAIREGMVNLRVRVPPTQRGLDALWRALLRHADTALATRQLAMQLSVYDILLLLAGLVAAARQSTRTARPGAGA